MNASKPADDLRDMAVETRATLMAHLAECSRHREALQADIAELKGIITGYAIEAKVGRRELHVRLDKALWGATAALGGISLALVGYFVKLLLER